MLSIFCSYTSVAIINLCAISVGVRICFGIPVCNVAENVSLNFYIITFLCLSNFCDLHNRI